MRVAILGAGKIGESLLAGLRSSGWTDVVVTVRRPERAEELHGRYDVEATTANADAVRDAVRAHAAEPSVRAVVLDAETIPYIDVTAAHMLIQLGGDLEREDVRLVMARDIGQVRYVLRRAEGERLPLSATRPCGTRSRRSPHRA